MAQTRPEILVYITACRERVITGSPLILFIPDGDEREQCLRDLGIALQGNSIQLKNGDHVIISK